VENETQSESRRQRSPSLVSLGGKRVLDVGYGGRLTVFAAGRAATVYAFDFSAVNVAAARRH